ncbi:1885_t:CDS:2, partial [Racocetra fulgida]
VPWLDNLLTDKEYEELYYLTPEMKKESELELKIYLSSILKDLITEKDQEINVIDQKEAAAMDEANILKQELIAIINSLLSSVNISDSSKYHGLKQKNCNQLQEIIQSIRDLHNEQDGLEDE